MTPSSEQLTTLARTSHRIIAGHQHVGGAYPASPTFSAYAGYAWLRDGSFTAEGMSRYGDVGSVGRFHEWVARVLNDRSDQVAALVAAARAGIRPPDLAMLPTRFTLSGANGTDPWWDFQTDGYGMWLWALVTHAERHGLDLDKYREAVEVAVDYLVTFWDRPCFDWWEEHVEERHTSTLGAIYAGLKAVRRAQILDVDRDEAAGTAAAALYQLVAARGLSTAVRAGSPAPHLTKWFGSEAVDGSLAACVMPFGLFGVRDPVARATIEAVAADLDVDGGVHRFRTDVFYGGGQWLLLSCLLGWNLAAIGDTAGARRHLAWVASHADEHGQLPEQVAGHLLHPQHRAEWVARWGPVATPLLWSHGMYLILADELDLLPEEPAR